MKLTRSKLKEIIREELLTEKIEEIPKDYNIVQLRKGTYFIEYSNIWFEPTLSELKKKEADLLKLFKKLKINGSIKGQAQVVQAGEAIGFGFKFTTKDDLTTQFSIHDKSRGYFIN